MLSSGGEVMDTNRHRTNRFGGSNGYGLSNVIYRDGGVWVFKPKTVRNGVVLYGKVISLRNGRRVYDLKKERIGAYQFNYACSCLGNFLGHYLCAHIARFKLAETATVKHNGTPDPRYY